MARYKKIKHPTIRKLRNRGITPLRYRAEDGACYVGWIEKRGYKWMYFRFAGDQTRKKIPVTEERYMEEL